MKRQTPIQTQKETMLPQIRGLLSHAAVRTTSDHDMPSNVSAETRFGHDFSQVAVRSSAPIVSQDYLNATCSMFPQRRPFGGACHTCPPRVQVKLKIGQRGDKYEQEADRVADQVLARHAHPIVSDAPPHIQRYAVQATGQADTAPASVHRVLASPGRPLGPALQQDMEQRFGHVFSGVRVHTDAKAAESARSVNALAYTVGRDIVFQPEYYKPESTEGQRLLVHELTHVMQQERGLSASTLQRETRRPRPAPVDANAQRIIDLAQNTARPIDQRAVSVVRAIINQYFTADASKVSGINYIADEPGLGITFVGSGAATTGILDVGRYFVENTTQRHFARRVLQVRHEIEHVDQVRSGMAGPSRSDEREFIAFYHEALAEALPGTGRLQHSTRVRLIDGALGYYYCLASELQSANAARRDELIARRAEEVRRSGRDDLGEAPTTCRRAHGDRGSIRGSARSGGLSGGAIAGIVLGAIAGAAAIGVGIAALAGAF